jgi:DNA polymerase/3'-5' exonuclease PolX
MDIYGVGSTIAKKWYFEGDRSIEDIKKRKDLTKSQLLGIKYVNDFREKIPRSEVENIHKVICDMLKESLPSLQILCLGSFARGAEECGDIDLLIYDKNDKMNEFSILKNAVDYLQKNDVISDILSLSTHNLRGVCKLATGKHRRLDILLTNVANLGAATLHFIGNSYL